MSKTVVEFAQKMEKTDWIETAQTLGLEFGRRAADYDESGAFVAENYADLARHKLFSAPIPAELGGGGASYEQMCGVIRTIGRHCASTALTFAMHTHPIALNIVKYRRGDQAAAKTLTKLAAGNLIIATTGANDWLESSGSAERVDGGYRVTARKRFVSGGPGADLLVTSTGYQGRDGEEVLHFAVPMGTEGVEIIETWRTIGMRGTGSNDVALNQVFVPDSAIVARRPAGQWHPMWDAIIPSALPVITAAYVGLAESAVSLALEAARRKPDELAAVVGEMMNEFTTAELALDDMVRINDDHGFTPSVETANAILTRKAIAAAAVKQVVEIASELVGGPGFFRGHSMERIVRDVRAMNFHPLPIRRQQVFSGRVALGQNPVP